MIGMIFLVTCYLPALERVVFCSVTVTELFHTFVNWIQDYFSVKKKILLFSSLIQKNAMAYQLQ